MNYRHFYHAGNFADVFKHLIMVLATDYLQQKDKGLMLLDSFAGCGIYDLSAPEAQKTGEYAEGIGQIMSIGSLNADLRRYQDLIEPYWLKHTYPGSPLLLAKLLRPQDRIIANELHPEDYESLRLALGRFNHTRLTKMDAYECIRANIPPQERRGLVLIDPPFEKKNEFELLIHQMQEWKKRWSTGCYMIWYPIKAHLPVTALHDAARELGLNRTWVADFLIHDRDQPDTFNGCGVLMMNTPYQLPEKISTLTPELCSLLGGRMETTYLTDE